MSPSVSLVRVAQLAATPYAYAAIPAPDARLVFLAGACPLDADGATVGTGDIAAQAAQALDNLVVALHSAGATLTDVVQTRVLVASTNRQDLVVAWEAVSERFGNHDVPSTLMGVTVLGYPDQLVEIEAIAAVID